MPIRKAWNKGLPAPWAKNLPQRFKKGVKQRLGKKASKETIEKLSKSHTGKTGSNASNWRGGLSYGYKVKNAPRARPELCEACGNSGTICFDHNHTTGEFRGWICMQCNFALGLVHDDREVLVALIHYLDKNETN